MATKVSNTSVYTLLVHVGRAKGDGLPDGSEGAALVCYASGVSEDEAVRETVAVLKRADLAPLEVTGYGSREDRIAEGHDLDAAELELMDRAQNENAVIIAEMVPVFPDG